MGQTGREMIERERERLKLVLKHLDDDHDAAGNLLNAVATETRASILRQIANCDELLSGSDDA